MVLTSANLSETAFRKRYEIGASLNKNESKEFIKYYSDIWKIGEAVNTKNLMDENKFRKRFGKSKDEKGSGFPVLFDIKIPKIVKQKRWIKFSGFSDRIRREKLIDLKEAENSGFINTKKGRNSGGKPSFKKDDILILTRMGINKGKEDIYIYGRAKIDIPHREDKDNLINYLKYIPKNKKDIIERINRWPFGVWLKDLELIKDKNKGFIWLSELEDKKKERVIKSESVNNQSHIEIKDEKYYDIINKSLENRFKKFGKIEKEKPSKN